MSLHLVGVVWRSSWRLGSRRSSTPSRSSSTSRLLRPAQTVHLKSTKGTLITLPPNRNGSQPMASYARNSGRTHPGPAKHGSGWKSGCCS
ncbi:hypothetical protein Taro_042501 [Colocasia esculenta]|uniref:Uncharacterized protein n=1 Tax=Colocasia esculenta TaxID=4460 RepID=A0A843WP46_COLES|nr:hypothetical protein [Colocasia esculenta]